MKNPSVRHSSERYVCPQNHKRFIGNVVNHILCKNQVNWFGSHRAGSVATTKLHRVRSPFSAGKFTDSSNHFLTTGPNPKAAADGVDPSWLEMRTNVGTITQLLDEDNQPSEEETFSVRSLSLSSETINSTNTSDELAYTNGDQSGYTRAQCYKILGTKSFENYVVPVTSTSAPTSGWIRPYQTNPDKHRQNCELYIRKSGPLIGQSETNRCLPNKGDATQKNSYQSRLFHNSSLINSPHSAHSCPRRPKSSSCISHTRHISLKPRGWHSTMSMKDRVHYNANRAPYQEPTTANHPRQATDAHDFEVEEKYMKIFLINWSKTFDTVCSFLYEAEQVPVEPRLYRVTPSRIIAVQSECDIQDALEITYTSVDSSVHPPALVVVNFDAFTCEPYWPSSQETVYSHLKSSLDIKIDTKFRLTSYFEPTESRNPSNPSGHLIEWRCRNKSDTVLSDSGCPIWCYPENSENRINQNSLWSKPSGREIHKVETGDQMNEEVISVSDLVSRLSDCLEWKNCANCAETYSDSPREIRSFEKPNIATYPHHLPGDNPSEQHNERKDSTKSSLAQTNGSQNSRSNQTNCPSGSVACRSTGSTNTLAPIQLDIETSDDRTNIEVVVSPERGSPHPCTCNYPECPGRIDLANTDVIVRASLIRQKNSDVDANSRASTASPISKQLPYSVSLNGVPLPDLEGRDGEISLTMALPNTGHSDQSQTHEPRQTTQRSWVSSDSASTPRIKNSRLSVTSRGSSSNRAAQEVIVEVCYSPSTPTTGDDRKSYPEVRTPEHLRLNLCRQVPADDLVQPTEPSILQITESELGEVSSIGSVRDIQPPSVELAAEKTRPANQYTESRPTEVLRSPISESEPSVVSAQDNIEHPDLRASVVDERDRLDDRFSRSDQKLQEPASTRRASICSQSSIISFAKKKKSLTSITSEDPNGVNSTQLEYLGSITEKSPEIQITSVTVPAVQPKGLLIRTTTGYNEPGEAQFVPNQITETNLNVHEKQNQKQHEYQQEQQQDQLEQLQVASTARYEKNDEETSSLLSQAAQNQPIPSRTVESVTDVHVQRPEFYSVRPRYSDEPQYGEAKTSQAEPISETITMQSVVSRVGQQIVNPSKNLKTPNAAVTPADSDELQNSLSKNSEMSEHFQKDEIVKLKSETESQEIESLKRQNDIPVDDGSKESVRSTITATERTSLLQLPLDEQTQSETNPHPAFPILDAYDEPCNKPTIDDAAIPSQYKVGTSLPTIDPHRVTNTKTIFVGHVDNPFPEHEIYNVHSVYPIYQTDYADRFTQSTSCPLAYTYCCPHCRYPFYYPLPQSDTRYTTPRQSVTRNSQTTKNGPKYQPQISHPFAYDGRENRSQQQRSWSSPKSCPPVPDPDTFQSQTEVITERRIQNGRPLKYDASRDSSSTQSTGFCRVIQKRSLRWCSPIQCCSSCVRPNAAQLYPDY